MITNSKRVEYDAISGKLFVFNSRLCNLVNKKLKAYGSGAYYFQAAEEAVFKVPLDQLGAVMAAVESFN